MIVLAKQDNSPVKVSYIVIDLKTGVKANNTVYSSRVMASRAVDRLDRIFGGYRYYAKAI